MMGRRVTRWGRWRTVLLVVLLLLPGTPEVLSRLYAEHAARERALAALAPGRNALPEQRERHQAAPPAPSGAYPPYPLNLSLDAEIVRLPGSPANVDFETAPADVGSPPTSHGFASGDFTGWATTGVPTIGSDGTQGSYASLPASAAIETTDALALDPGAQFVTLKVKGLTSSADKAIVDVLSGPGFGTVTQGWSGTAADGSWTTVKVFAQTWQGQPVKLKVRNNGGTVGTDDVGVQRAEVPGWTIPSGATLVAGSPSGSALKIDGTLTSGAFTFPADVQQLTLRYRASDASGTGLYVDLLTGAGFATVVQLSGGVLGGPSGVWKSWTKPIANYAGQTVKLRFRKQLQSVYVDDAGLLERALPGWTVVTDSPFGGVLPGTDADGTYVTGTNGDLLLQSSTIDPGIVDVAGSQGRSYVLRAAIGQGTNSLLVVRWLGPTQTYTVLSTSASSPTGVKNYRFTVSDGFGAPGRLEIKLTNGGRLYAVGDNVARQQLSEPFSQQAGAGVDTSTGSFGMSETDLTVQGGPLPLSFTRYYHGHSDRYAELGFRWSHTFDTYLGIYGSDVAVVFGSGKEEVFRDDGGFAPLDARVKSTLTKYTNPPDGVDYRYKTKDGLTYNFEGDGDLISIQDRNANTVTLYRDPTTERITSVADPGGRAIAFAYDANGRLASVTGPDGAAVSYGYDANGDLVAVDKPEDARTEYAYSRHRLTQVKQRQGADLPAATMVTVLTNGLDEVNRVVAQTDAAGKTTAIAYLTGANQGITRFTDPLANATDFFFDTYARTTHVKLPTGDVGQFVYDTSGNLQKVIDPTTNDYQFAYNGSADPTGITDPLGNPMAITWDAVKHLPTQITDARGAVTKNTYDANGNLITTIADWSDPSTGHLNLRTDYEYDTTGQMTKQTIDPGTGRLNLIITFAYDAAGNRLSKTVDPGTSPHLNLTWSWTYDGAGRMLTETDPNSHTTTYVYDVLGRLRTVRNALGDEYRYFRDLEGRPLELTDPLGNKVEWTYDGRGLVTTRKDPAGNVTTFAYDGNGNVKTVTNALGKVTTFTYDAANRLVSETDPLNRTTSSSYDGAGRLASETVDPGAPPHLNLTTSYTYDDAGRVIGTTLPNGSVWTFVYDANGNKTSESDPLNHTTTYVYDAANRLVSVTDPLGRTTSYDYDAASRLTAVTDPLGVVTSFTYDAASRRTSVTVDPGSAPHLSLVTALGYDAAGNLARQTDAMGRITWYEYDPLNRLVEITDPLSRVTTFDHDAVGRRTRVTLPSGRVTEYTLNSRGLLTKEVVDPGAGHLNLTATFGYDQLGRRTSMTNPRGYTTSYGYNDAGDLTTITDALNGVVTFGYDVAGRQTSAANPRGKTSTLAYDALGNLTRETDPLNRSRVSAYDLAGRLTQTTDARGTVVKYVYDDADRLTKVRDGNDADLIVYGYDNGDRRTSMVDGTGSTSWTYDAASRVTGVTSPQGAIGFTYDKADRRLTMTLPGNRTVSYGYDNAGQLTNQTDWQSRAITYGYDLDGRLTGEVRPNGVSTSYQYDGAGRLTVVESAKGADMLHRFAYGLNANGSRTSAVVTGSAVGNGTEFYSYDELDRLTRATYTDGGVVDYAYDANGNRLTQTSGSQVTTYAYDDADQLTSVSGATNLSYSYDANGNRIGVGNDTFQYDWRDRLTQASVGGSTVAYDYDGDDLRVNRTTGGATTPLLWDRGESLPTIVDDGTAYVHGPQGLAEEVTGTGERRYPIRDGLGSIRIRTDGGGTVVGANDYDVWGNVRAASGTGGLFGWTGEARDASTGLTYLRARDYAPASGRFLQRDAVQPNAPGSQGYNPYAYAANNPATLTDPSGHSAGHVAWEVVQEVFVASVEHRFAIVESTLFAAMWGRALVPLVIGSNIAFLFAVVALALIVAIALVIAIHELLAWCAKTGKCSGMSGRVRAWIRGDSHRGGTDFDWGVSAGGSGAGGAGGAGTGAGTNLCHPVIAAGVKAAPVFGAQPQECQGATGGGTGGGVAPQPATPAQPGAGGGSTAGVPNQPGNPPAVITYDGPCAPYVRPRDPNDIARQQNYPTPPRPQITGRVGQGAAQNAQFRADLAHVQVLTALDIRVTQEQVNAGLIRVGINKPDLQYTYGGQRYYVEYDKPPPTRAFGHRTRICSNDPLGWVTLKVI